MSLTCHEEVGRVGQGCYEDDSDRVVGNEWCVSCSWTLGNDRTHARTGSTTPQQTAMSDILVASLRGCRSCRACRRGLSCYEEIAPVELKLHATGSGRQRRSWFWPIGPIIYENVMSSTTPEVHNVSQRIATSSEEDRSMATDTCTKNLVKMDRVMVFELCERINRQTNCHTHHKTFWCNNSSPQQLLTWPAVW